MKKTWSDFWTNGRTPPPPPRPATPDEELVERVRLVTNNLNAVISEAEAAGLDLNLTTRVTLRGGRVLVAVSFGGAIRRIGVSA